jgi:tripartite-type tricarboxylate transporter receptor subunit TctC
MAVIERYFLWALISSMVLSAAAYAAERPYYQGKNINFLINFAAGGPTDIEGRIVARHLAKHIPGNPTIIVQNMPGAGGVTGINFLGEAAKRDSLTLGYFTGPYNHHMMKSVTLRTDLMQLPFVASVGSVTVACLSTATKICASGSPSTFSGSNTITSLATTAAMMRGWRFSAMRFSIMTKIFRVIAAWSNRNW